MTEPISETRFQILGPVAACSLDGVMLRFGSTTQRRLLAALLVNANSVVPSDRLSDWCDLTPGALRTAISRLRKVLGPDTIFQEPPGYVLRTTSVDAHEFEQLVEQSRTATAGAALQYLDEALGLWNGDALVDFADEPWARATAVSLSELRASAIEDRAETLLGLGKWADAIVSMERHIDRYPLRDRARGLLMRSLAADGRQAEALRSYQSYRTYLRDETGTDPSDEIKALEAKIATGWRDRTHSVIGNLAPQPTSFIGRQRELREVAELVRQHQLVTLTGVGGVGKTRLAVQVASELASEFDDGAWMVELGPVGDPRAVPDAVATALGITVQARTSVTATIADALAGRRALIVLDNCEHVLDASSALLEAVLKTSRSASFIATSREGTRVRGEHLWPVPSLGTDEGADSPAVELFVERAEQVNPAFTLHVGGNLEAVLEICQRLDGIALAIELAAARMVSMSPAEVASRLHDRFRMLAGNQRVVERHQTLRHAVQWSYDQLTSVEQLVLRTCAIFAGGFDLAAVTAVGEHFDEYEILNCLDSLVRKSLITVNHGDGRSRYSVLETIRYFAEEQDGPNLPQSGTTQHETRLGFNITEIRDQHARYFANQAAAQFANWDGPQMDQAAEWLELEFDNLRAGYLWSRERNDIASATAIAAHSPMIAFGLQRLEPVSWAEELIPLAIEAHTRQLPRLHTAASLCAYLGRPAESLNHAQAATELQVHPEFDGFDIAWPLFRQAVAHLDAGRSDLYIEICGDLADQDGLAHVVGLCGLVAFLPSVGRADEARSIADDAMTAAKERGNPYWVAFAHVGFGRAFAETEPDRAMEKLRQGLAYAREHPIPYWEAVFAREAGGLEAVHGDPEQALDLLNTSLDAFHQAGNTATLGWTFASLVVLFDRIGYPKRAATIVGATTHYPIEDLILGFGDAVANLRSTLDSFSADVSTGAAMEIADVVRYAHEQIENVRAQIRPASSDTGPAPSQSV